MPFGRVIGNSMKVHGLTAREVLATMGKSLLEGRIRHQAQCRQIATGARATAMV